MLKHVLIVSNSGLLLYCKEFIKFIKNESQIAGLLTAVEKASTNNTGMQLSYIELTNVAVVIVSHQEAPGYDFGRIVANELLSCFVEAYPQINKMASFRVFSTKEYAKFGAKIAEALRSCVRPVLDQLQTNRGVELACLLLGDEILYTTVEIDKFALVANLVALINVSSDLMLNDSAVMLTLDCGPDSLVQVQTVDRTYILVCLLHKNVQRDFLNAQLCKSVTLIRKVIQTVASVTALPM